MEIQDDVGWKGVPFAQADTDAPAEPLALDLIGDFNAESDPASLARLVVLRAVVETRSDRGVLSWIEGDEMVVAACYDPFGELVPVGGRWPLAGEQVVAVALAAGRPSATSLRDVTDVTNAAISPALRETYAGISHLLAVPVRAGGEDIALLCVSRRRTEEFSAQDSATLDAVAAAAAQPLRAARIQEQLDAALAELSELAARADFVELIKTDILRLASHELRSPLTVLHGYLSLVQGGFFGEIPEPLGGVMAILQRRTEEMNALVNDMLVAARIEDTPAETEGEIVDLRDLVRDATAGVMPRASAGHSLRVEIPDHAVLARVDPDRVVLALRNVMDNAVKYSPNGGEVTCQLVRDGEVARIRVADHGLGIAEEDREKLFTRFGRVLTTANSHIPGIGLGLYFSREVARRHGGDVALVEADGAAEGSVFEVTLPIAG